MVRFWFSATSSTLLIILTMIVGSMQENAVKTNFNKFNEVLLKLRFKEVFRNLVIHID